MGGHFHVAGVPQRPEGLHNVVPVTGGCGLSGRPGAIEGIRAVEKNLLSGKILVYPSCRGLKPTPLTELGAKVPLKNGHWSRQAEEALLKQFPRT
jgi:hypothetical protein